MLPHHQLHQAGYQHCTSQQPPINTDQLICQQAPAADWPQNAHQILLVEQNQPIILQQSHKHNYCMNNN